MVNNFQDILTWLQANAAWLQVVAAIVQSIASVIAIYVTLRAANRSVRLAFEMNERKELEKSHEQIRLLRFSLGLEIEGNIKNLRRFYDNSTTALSEEQTTDAETTESRETRQRLIAFNMPSLSYRFWHSQQLSSLLPLALNRAQIRDVNRIYSDFDRLSRISKTFGEEALGRGVFPSRHHAAAVGDVAARLSSASQLEKLLDDFEISLRDVLSIGNPLGDVIKEDEEGRYISENPEQTQSALRRATRSDIDTSI